MEGSRPAVPGCSPWGECGHRIGHLGSAHLGESVHRAVDELLPGDGRDVRHGHVRMTILLGLSGQVSLGNGALMAIGGYIFALTSMNWQTVPILGTPWNAVWSMVFAGFGGVVFGAAIGGIAARLARTVPRGSHPRYRRRSARDRQSVPRTSGRRKRPHAPGSVSGGRLHQRRHIRRSRGRRWRGAAG